MALHCDVCGCGSPAEFINLGDQPLANIFSSRHATPPEKYPLKYAFCENCQTVFSVNPPPPNALEFDYRSYHYVPFGATLQKHYSDLANEVASRVSLGPDDLALDIGSNDGTFLANLSSRVRCKILGIEPARRLTHAANERGIPTLQRFLNARTANHVLAIHGRAKLISTTQVLQHIPKPVEALRLIKSMLADDGWYLYEGRSLYDMFMQGTYDTLYHELLHLFSEKSLSSMFQDIGFSQPYFNHDTVYGGSLRAYAMKRSQPFWPSASGPRLRLEDFLLFGADARKNIDELKQVISDLCQRGHTVVAYGAPSTGNTILNSCGFTTKEIKYVIDDSPLKQGYFTPGSNIPIVGEEKHPGEYVLLLAWRLADDILPRLKGRNVIVPLPTVRVVE